MACKRGLRMASRLAVGVLAILTGMSGGCAEPANSKQTTSPPLSLTIITPHSDRIQQSFEVGFSEWHRAEMGRNVDIQWITRGTPQCVQYIEDIFESRGGAESGGRPDVMFGGGIADHAMLTRAGRTRKIDVAKAIADIPESINDMPTRDREGHWYATGLSTFGIIYNHGMCEIRDVTPPVTWSDLAGPAYFGWTAIADPTASGSHAQAMVMILERFGWQEGWPIIIRTLANARVLAPGSSMATEQVTSGYCLAGYSVNFTGLAAQESERGVKYINPDGATAATPDVISVLKTSTNPDLAARFVEFCLSKPGQATWGVRPEFRQTVGDTLYHYPINPKIYEEFEGKLAVNENPFQSTFGTTIDLDRAANESALIAPLVQAACGDNHVLLQRAWRAIINNDMNAEALAELTKLPIDPEKIEDLAGTWRNADQNRREEMLADWSTQFRKRYEQALETCNSKPGA